MTLRQMLAVAFALPTFVQSQAVVAQQVSAIHMVAAMIPLAEGAQTYCESEYPGTGAAIARALVDLKSGQSEYLAWMVKQRFYLDSKQNVAEGMAKNPRAFLQQYGPDMSCQNLPKTLASLTPALARETASQDFKYVERMVERRPYYLVPPKGATQVPADSAACLDEAKTARTLTASERGLFEGRPTDNFVAKGQARFGLEGYPFASGGSKPDESTPLTDWYVFCLLRRGYTWLEPGKPK